MSLIRTVGDWIAASITVATILQWLPALSVIGAVVWYAVQLWEKVYGKPFSESSLAKWIRGEK